MPLVDLIDETFVVCDPGVLATRLHDESLWHAWWPDVQLSVFMDRGEQGIRWSMTGALIGSSEVWLEPFSDGVIVHYYLRGDVPTPHPARARHRWGERLRRQHAQHWKSHVNALKDELEGGRLLGCSRLMAAVG